MQMLGLWPIRIGRFIFGQPINIYGKFVEHNWWVTGFPGIIGQQNIMGAYLAIGTPLFLVYGKVKKIPVGLIIVLTATLFTKSVMAMVSAVSGIMVYEWLRADRSRMRIIFILSLTVLSAPLILKYIHSPDWLSRWQAIKFVFSHPTMTGYGLGAFLLNARRDAGGWMAQAHNEYAQVMFELGLVSLAIIFCYMANMFDRVLSIMKRSKELNLLIACMVSLSINAIGNFTFHHAVLALLGLTLMGLLEVNLRQNNSWRYLNG